MPTYDYATLENRLRQALELTQKVLAPVHVQNVRDFLDAAEYGLAFETLAGAIVEANVPLTGRLCSLMREAASRMNYREDFSNVHESEVAAILRRVWEACRDCAQ